jgi:hypothetical protein
MLFTLSTMNEMKIQQADPAVDVIAGNLEHPFDSESTLLDAIPTSAQANVLPTKR